MAEHTLIDQAKETLRQEATELQERLEKVRHALKSLEELGSRNGNVGTRPAGNHRLGGMTMIKAAAVVLKDAHEPLHISEIIERMTAGGYRPENPKSLRLSLVGSLDRGSKPDTPGWFYKPSPATYGLREWQTP